MGFDYFALEGGCGLLELRLTITLPTDDSLTLTSTVELAIVLCTMAAGYV